MGFVSHFCAQHPRLVLWLHCLFENEERYHHFGGYLYLYWLAGTLKLSKVGWMPLMCPPRCRVSRLVTLDTPHASPLAPCVSHERSLCPGHFWPEVWHVCAEQLCSVQPACPYGSKVVTLTSVPGCSWQPRVPGVGLPSSLQTRIISSAMIHPKWPSVCTGENCHTAGAIVTNIGGGATLRKSVVNISSRGGSHCLHLYWR